MPVIAAGQNKSPVDSASHNAAHVRRERGKSLKLVRGRERKKSSI